MRPRGNAGAQNPGVVRQFFFGNASRFRSDPLSFLLICSNIDGPLVQIDDEVYLVTDPDLIEAVFHDKKRFFVKSLPGEAPGMVNFPASVMNSSGEDWRWKRKSLQSAFHHDRVDRSVKETFALAERHLSQWPDAPAQFDIREGLQPLCLDVGCQFLFGTTLTEAEKTSFIDLADAVMIKTRDRRPFPFWPFDRTEARLKATRQHAYGMASIILARTSRWREENSRLFSEPSTTTQGGPKDWMRDEVAAMILSGLEPMADALAWTLHLLVRHPAILRDVVAEVDRVTSERDGSEAAGLAKLVRTRASLKEALRLFPPAWLTGRIVAEDGNLNGFDLRRGAALMISPWVSHRSGRYFSAPEEYRPDRWLDGTLERRLPRYAFFPFGGGSRRCIGDHFSMTHMLTILACVLRRFTLSAAPGVDVRPYPALVLRPLGIRMILTSRHSRAETNGSCS